MTGFSAPPRPRRDDDLTDKLAEGCNNLGVLYQRGTGVSADFAEARRLYGLACDGGDPQGCVNLGIMLRQSGDGKGALVMFEKACAQKHLRGCAGAWTPGCSRPTTIYALFRRALPTERAEGAGFAAAAPRHSEIAAAAASWAPR